MQITINNLNEQLDCSIFPPTFVLSNEIVELDAIIKTFDIKTALSVAASGEQALKMILCGIQDLTLFDINPWAIAYCVLLFTLIENVEYEEFIQFLGFDENLNSVITCFQYTTEYKNNTEIYEKIKGKLPLEIEQMWSSLFYSSLPLPNHPIFMDQTDAIARKSPKLHPMFKAEEFYRLKTLLANVNINFICSDIKDLHQHIPDDYQFDFAYFSNISDWLFDEKTFKTIIEGILSKYGIPVAITRISLNTYDKEKIKCSGYWNIKFILQDDDYTSPSYSHKNAMEVNIAQGEIGNTIEYLARMIKSQLSTFTNQSKR